MNNIIFGFICLLLVGILLGIAIGYLLFSKEK